MGRKRKSKTAISKGWEDLKTHYSQKSWKYNPKCPEAVRKQVNKIEYLKRMEEAKDE